MALPLRRKSVLQLSATAILIILAALVAVRSTAGIQGSGLRAFAAIGPITTLGSGTVTVGGVDYATGAAQINIDGHPGTQQQLQPGDVVSLQGTWLRGERWQVAAANTLTFNGNVRGAVSGIDTASATFFVLGQTVHVNSSTRFAPGIQPAGLQGLQNGTVVEVSGFADSSGDILATAVRSAGHSSSARVLGTIQNLNPQQQTFNLQSLVVSYAGASVKGTLADGTAVAAQGPEPPANGILRATQVSVAPALQAHSGAEGRIEGLITDLASGNYFEVDGQPVSVDAQTRLNLHVPLGLNVWVKVTGGFDGNGTLVAREVQSKATQD